MLNSKVPAAYAEFEGDRQFATTLARGLELLRCFTPEHPVLGNKEISKRLGLPAATVSRLTYTLLRMGYLAQDEGYGKYRLGSAVLSLGYPLLELFQIRQRARPLMLALAQEVGGTVSIGVRDRLSIVYIEALRGRARAGAAYPVDVGTNHSMAGTAIGRAWLMACPAPQREALLNQLRVKAPDEWARHEASLLRNLAQYPATGCCTSVGDIHPDVQAVAVPLGRIDRGEIAAINCSFQGRALDEGWLRETIAPQLMALVRRVV
jgi:DNA-binding IclR family transcriptional regulator